MCNPAQKSSKVHCDTCPPVSVWKNRLWLQTETRCCTQAAGNHLFFFYREPRQATNEKCYKNLKKRKRKKDTIIQTRHIRKLYTNQCAGCNFLHYKCFSSHINIDTFYVLLCTNSHCCTRVCLFAERKTCNHGVLLVQNWKNKNKHCAFIPNTKDHETMKKIIMHKGWDKLQDQTLQEKQWLKTA